MLAVPASLVAGVLGLLFDSEKGTAKVSAAVSGLLVAPA